MLAFGIVGLVGFRLESLENSVVQFGGGFFREGDCGNAGSRYTRPERDEIDDTLDQLVSLASARASLDKERFVERLLNPFAGYLKSLSSATVAHGSLPSTRST